MLTHLEEAAIAIGRRDAERGIRVGSGPLARLVAAITGERGAKPLADTRLEALRGFAYAVRRSGGRVADAAARRLLDVGYTPDLIPIAACRSAGRC